ncbi:hypothetical protein ES705_16733 [subsurface metagenome]
MAKLTNLPALEIIAGYKGTIDFYVHDGIACARSWPRSPGHDRAPAVQAQWPAWTIASRLWALTDTATKDAFNAMAAGTNLTGRDIQVKSYITSEHLHNVP